jgi:hypothetical protein
LQEYAASLISDPNHSGPLKCPCCPRLLRVEDATIALDKQRSAHSGRLSRQRLMNHNATSIQASKDMSTRRINRQGFVTASGNERDVIDSQALRVLERWDNKVRDNTLRLMGDFRPCPHCSDHKDATHERNNNQGGGFVTPECLAQINDEREAKSERLLKLTGTPSAMVSVLSYAVYYLYCSAGETSISFGDQQSVFLQLTAALVPSLLLPIMPHALGVLLALVARKILMSPIVVTCPCCFREFNLEASSELQLAGGALAGDGAEAATQQWKLSHTRPCPGCASPIIKDGGCNHVRCGRCRVEFCWACMRTRTSCNAFQCKNGAPFGNAAGIGSLLRDQEAGLTLVERIDRAESVSRRNLGSLRSVMAFYAAWVSINFVPLSASTTAGNVAATLWRMLSLLASRLWLPIMYIIVFMVLRAFVTGHIQLGSRREEQQFAEAITRSLVEQ